MVQTSRPLKDEQEVALSKQNVRAACPKHKLEFKFFFLSPDSVHKIHHYLRARGKVVRLISLIVLIIPRLLTFMVDKIRKNKKLDAILWSLTVPTPSTVSSIWH